RIWIIAPIVVILAAIALNPLALSYLHVTGAGYYVLLALQLVSLLFGYMCALYIIAIPVTYAEVLYGTVKSKSLLEIGSMLKIGSVVVRSDMGTLFRAALGMTSMGRELSVRTRQLVDQRRQLRPD